MKKLKFKLIAILSLLLFTIMSNAQVPQAFYLQAFASDEVGQPLANQEIGVQLKIIQDSLSGPIVYIETHDTYTNPVGAIDLMVGLGTIISGEFEEIDWATGTYFMEISMDQTGGTNYELMGVSQFLSVPYALQALNLVGAPGPQGPTGPQGAAGATGATGAMGAACWGCGGSGNQGDTGPTGPTGQDGLPGLDTDGINCWDLNGNHEGEADEDTNNDGIFSVADCNLPGLPGLQGQVGNSGPKGANGPEGPAGEDGLQGSQGDSGPEGPQGDPTFAKWETSGNMVYKLNSSIGIGTTTPNCKLDVSGDICANGVVLTSDKRFKKNIQPLEPTINQLSAIRGVSYDFKQNEFPQKDFSNENQIGLIAQEVEAVYPELVKTDGEGYKSVNYDQLIPVLVQALQELVIEKESMNERRANHLQSLNAKVELLYSLLAEKPQVVAEEE